MTRILGEAQSGRSFWLVLLLAVALLVGVSTTAARAEAAAMARIERDLGALHVLTESLDGAASRRIPAPVHPALADGSDDYLRNASVRRIVALQRRLGALEEIATGAPSGRARAGRWRGKPTACTGCSWRRPAIPRSPRTSARRCSGCRSPGRRWCDRWPRAAWSRSRP